MQCCAVCLLLSFTLLYLTGIFCSFLTVFWFCGVNGEVTVEYLPGSLVGDVSFVVCTFLVIPLNPANIVVLTMKNRKPKTKTSSSNKNCHFEYEGRRKYFIVN